MMLYLLILAVLIIIGLFILLATSYSPDQTITCPVCGYDFPVNLFFTFNRAVVQCPYCRRWISITKHREEKIVERLR
ncbi:MAG: hypothetical protein ACE5Z5_02445 [Candidatus Bathyarchaeia archaeon]